MKQCVRFLSDVSNLTVERVKELEGRREGGREGGDKEEMEVGREGGREGGDKEEIEGGRGTKGTRGR